MKQGMRKEVDKVLGRAKTVLVFGDREHVKGVVSAIDARVIHSNIKNRFTFIGPVQFSRRTIQHIHGVVLRIMDDISTHLNLPKCNYEISAMNLGAASAQEIGLNISGYSADTAIFLALLSATLGLPLRQDVVSTGHIASIQGDISAVKNIPAKLEAVAAEGSSIQFICPDSKKDISLEILSPQEFEHCSRATLLSSDSLIIHHAGDIHQLCEFVLVEEDILISCLRADYWESNAATRADKSPPNRLVNLLAGRCRKRFWRHLDRCFQDDRFDTAQDMLDAFVHLHEQRQQYPPLIGHQLKTIVNSVLPAKRRMRMSFPLLDTGRCLHFVSSVQPKYYPDALDFLDAVHGRHLQKREPDEGGINPTSCCAPNGECELFDLVTSRMTEQMMAAKIDIAIDAARGSYSLDRSIVDSYEEFMDVLLAFYIYLRNHVDVRIQGTEVNELVKGDCIQLMEDTYKDHGGVSGAFVQAREGTNGGLRNVLDNVTEQFKHQRQGDYVLGVLKEAICDFDWEQRVEFVRGAISRLGPLLPADIRNGSVERFAKDYEAIARACVNLRNNLTHTFQTL